MTWCNMTSSCSLHALQVQCCALRLLEIHRASPFVVPGYRSHKCCSPKAPSLSGLNCVDYGCAVPVLCCCCQVGRRHHRGGKWPSGPFLRDRQPPSSGQRLSSSHCCTKDPQADAWHGSELHMQLCPNAIFFVYFIILLIHDVCVNPAGLT